MRKGQTTHTWITNGTDEKNVLKNSIIPEGWRRGRSDYTKQKQKNGNIKFRQNNTILDSTKIKMKESQRIRRSKNKEIHITNGNISRRISQQEIIPEGWWRGRLLEKKDRLDNPSCAHYTEEQKKFLQEFPKNYRKYHIEQEIPLSILSRKMGFSTNVLVDTARYLNLPAHKFTTSFPHKQLIEWLGTHKIQFNVNDRTVIKPQELDLYLTNDKLAIEINGIYYHSRYGRSYHLDKLRKCNGIGVDLLQFWDFEINEKFDIVTSIINSRLGKLERLYARNTIIDIVTSEESRKFLDENHIQGDANASVRIGLRHNGKLVSLMTFSKTRFSQKFEWEMVRFCNLKNFVVIGAASRLFNKFIATKFPKSIVSYSDRRLFNGTLYPKLGFVENKKSSPNYWYFCNSEPFLHHRVQFQKHKLNKLQKFDPNKTEKQNMQENGWLWVYDCGNVVWVWENAKH